jgi:hypothetical protein
VVPNEELRKLKLSTEFRYQCRPISATPRIRQHSLLPWDDGRRLWQASTELYNVEKYAAMESNAPVFSRRDILHVTTTAEPGASFGREIVFGIASDVERVKIRAEALAYWLANTRALLIVSLPAEEEGEKARELFQILSALGINAKIVTHRLNSVERYVHLTMDFAEARRWYHKWFSYIDDDTFFISGSRLRRLLAKYDSREELYIGSYSEDWMAVRAMQDMYAFGGAGVIVSAALLGHLAQTYEQCIKDWPKPFGDYQLARCVYRHTHARMSPEYSMHQGDLKGNVNGFFESGQFMTSVHHWNSWWFNVDVTQYVVVGAKATTGGIGERYRFLSPHSGRSNAVLTNGYSLVEYPDDLVEQIDFSRMEQTWDNRTEEDPRYIFDFHLGPLRYPLIEGKQRHTYLMERSWQDHTQPAAPVHQVYVRRAMGEADDVLHLMWL